MGPNSQVRSIKVNVSVFSLWQLHDVLSCFHLNVAAEDEEWVEIPRLERRSSRESGAGTSSSGGFGQRQDVHFRAFDRHFNLTLHPSPDLISPSFTIVVRRGESAQLDANASSGGRQIQNCLYRGRSTNGDELIGTAAFDLCRGLVTAIFLSGNQNERIPSPEAIPHRMEGSHVDVTLQIPVKHEIDGQRTQKEIHS